MSLLHGDQDFDDEPMGRRDREISLGTSTMLGIFFALTLVCAGFFGFGYSLGRKSMAAPAADADGSGSNGTETFRTFKPSPGAPAITAAPGYSAQEAAQANSTTVGTNYTPVGAPLKLAAPGSGKTPVTPVAGSLTPPLPTTRKPFDPDASVVGDEPKPAVAAVAPVAKPTPPPAATGGGTLVQVSAFSHQEDADAVSSALKRKGYNVFIRHEPQDNLLHVQLGPFPSHKEAEAMREKLSADGFNAIVK